jgi:hypothetical protein
MAGEALAILEAAVFTRAGPPTLADLDALRVRGMRPLTQDLIDLARDEGRL